MWSKEAERFARKNGFKDLKKGDVVVEIEKDVVRLKDYNTDEILDEIGYDGKVYDRRFWQKMFDIFFKNGGRGRKIRNFNLKKDFTYVCRNCTFVEVKDLKGDVYGFGKHLFNIVNDEIDIYERKFPQKTSFMKKDLKKVNSIRLTSNITNNTYSNLIKIIKEVYK